RHGELVLGYLASSTQSNASEVAAFAAARELHTIRLITSHYHMPRSLLEFRAAMPDVAILPDPVFPDGEREAWWQQEASHKLVLSEFHKYLAAWARTLCREN